MSAAALVDAWKEHVLQCGLCANAKGLADLCPIGRNFLSTADRAPEPPPQGQLVPKAPMDSATVNHLAQAAVSRVVAMSSSGAAIAVPMQKTSRSVEIQTGRDVILRMPEKDIEIYSEMKDLIGRLIRLAQALSSAVLVGEEAKKVVRSQPSLDASEEQVALVVRQARTHFGIGSDEALYEEFIDVMRRTLRIGDRLGNFMTVDETTRKIVREVRSLAMDMQGEQERTIGSALKLDDETRKLVRPMRMLAIELQGEIERRVGTP